MTAMRILRFFSPFQHFLIFQSLAGLILAVSQQQLCYTPSGSIAEGNFPCFLDQNQGPCCGLGFICEESGLCKVRGSTGVSDLIRGSCTDKTWASPECPQYCILPDAEDGGINVISCENVTNSKTAFCCDHDAGCCDSGIGRFEVSFNRDIVTIGSFGAAVTTFVSTSTFSSISSATTSSSISVSSSNTNTPSTTPSNTPSNTNTPSTTPSNASLNVSSKSNKATGLPTGAVIGISVGCTLVSLAVLGSALYFFLRRRSSNVSNARVENQDYQLHGFISPPQTQPTELMAHKISHEAELAA